VGFEALVVIYQDFEGIMGMLDLEMNETAQVAVSVVARRKRQLINVVMVLVACCVIVQEATDRAAMATI
jgi:hypothetical protein